MSHHLDEYECPVCDEPIPLKVSSYWHGSDVIQQDDLVTCPDCKTVLRWEPDAWWDSERGWRDRSSLVVAK